MEQNPWDGENGRVLYDLGKREEGKGVCSCTVLKKQVLHLKMGGGQGWQKHDHSPPA